MIKIAIVGYGKMGKIIESVIDSTEDMKLIGKYDIDNTIQNHMKEIPDVALEFSTPISMMPNLEFLAAKKVNIVCGTTGWHDKMDDVRRIVDKEAIGFICSSNFSLGVNIFFQLVKEASKMFNKFEGYDVAVHETHHNEKLDKPSGTALKIADILINNVRRKKGISKPDRRAENDKSLLDVSSTRLGKVVGEHSVLFDSLSDTISLEHHAKSRRGFAEGALLAARFIHGKQGFYEFEEIFKNLTL